MRTHAPASHHSWNRLLGYALATALIAAPGARAARATDAGAGDPAEPNKGIIFNPLDFDSEFESTNLPDILHTNQTLLMQVRLRNTGEFGWTPTIVDLDVITDTCDLFDSDERLQLTGGVPVGAVGVFQANIQAPSDETVCGLLLQPRVRVDLFGQTFHIPFGEPVDLIFGVSDEFTLFDLEDNRAGWTGAVVFGQGLANATPQGVCVSVPQLGDNLVVWTSPSGAVPLIDMRVYRMRVDASTDQSLPDAIPLWDVSYDNFYPSGFGSTYGGQSWFLDVAGGANGVDRPHGRDRFDVYAAPNAMLTPQWRAGAFTTAADPYNDMRVSVRALDFGSGGFNANADSGSVCVSRILVDAMRYEDFGHVSQLWTPPINSSTYSAQTFSQAAEVAGTAFLVENVAAIYQLTPSGPGSRKTLIPNDLSLGGGLASLYPIAWQTDWVYRGQAFLQSMVGGGLGPEGSDPVDLIALNYDTPTNEIGSVHFTTRGSFGNMRFAASPRVGPLTGGPQAYVAFFHGSNRTLSDLQGAGGLRLMVDLFNTPEIAPEGQGADPLAVLWTSVDRVEPPR